MQVTGKEYLLILRTCSDSKKVEVVPLLRDALLTWNARDRVSPIFEIHLPRGSDPWEFPHDRGFLLFIGPVNPARTETILSCLKSRTDHAWLALGLFNFVVLTASQRVAERARKWAMKSGYRWEQWFLESRKIKQKTHSPIPSKRPEALLRTLSEIRVKDSLTEFRDAANEYCALLAGVACRSLETHPEITKELELANSIISEAAFEPFAKTRAVKTLASVALLVDANAALSRFSSQMYSGILPIQESECHFWTHSLLGTGVANLALVKIRRFITSTLGEARIPEQVNRLRSITDEDLRKQVLNDGPIWNGPWLQNLPRSISEKPLLVRLKPLAPLVTYLSGRDGFHTTQTSLSAPLNIITSCSSLRWSLLTITHEMSHRVVDEALSYILPDASSPEELAVAAELLNERRKPADVLACLQFRILQTMAELNAASPQVAPQNEITEQHLVELMSSRREEIEEIMVHVFDFLYFYGGKPEVYVSAIWRSWDAIPSLHRRIPRYLLRTLCAVLAHTWNSDKCYDDAIKLVAASLERIPGSTFSRDAIDFLRRDADNQKRSMLRRRTLVGIVRTFLHSPELVQMVRGQAFSHPKPQRKPKGSNKRDFEPSFQEASIENPLRFIESYTSGSANTIKSFWMLTRLAFDTAEPKLLRVRGIHE